jgi:hypothetical protein
LLSKLLTAGDKAQAGLRVRAAVLTKTRMKAYLDLRDIRQKEACENTLLAAQDAGSITLARDRFNPDGLIERIELKDVEALARFLGEESYAVILERAREALEPLRGVHAEALDEVLSAWAAMKNVRGLGPQDTAIWLDAARVIEACASVQDLPLREFSAKFFRAQSSASKRVEKLFPALDVLLCGSTQARPRESAQVWQELGLLPQEQPVLLAGRVQVNRGRVQGLLDTPYSGLSAASIQAVTGSVEEVLTVENLTTFHSEARRRCDEPVLLIYTAGMPSPAWRAMYRRVLMSVGAAVPVRHWGDVDEGGFRIAACLAEVARQAGHVLQPWRMSPGDVPQNMRREATAATLARMEKFAATAGWPELGRELAAAGFTVEQEAL